MAIEKKPKDKFGTKLLFRHKGQGVRVWVGIGIAYPREAYFGLYGPHKTPFAYAMKERDVADDSIWTDYEEEVEGVLPEDMQTGVMLDALRFISSVLPGLETGPDNIYGANAWEYDAYSTPGARPDGGFDIVSMMMVMMMVMMMSTMFPGEEPEEKLGGQTKKELTRGK